MKLSTTTIPMSSRFGYDRAIELIAEAGFDAYDLDLCKIHVNENSFMGENYIEYVRYLKDVADKNGIICNQAHAPFPPQLNGNDEYNKMTFDATVRAMECASLLGAKNIVVHPIKNSSSAHVKQFSYTLYEDKQSLYDANIELFKNLIPYCEKYNIRIAVENMWERHPLSHDTLIPAFLGNAEEHASFIDALDSEWIVGCLDIGHAIICAQKPDAVIRKLGKNRLKALHVHDTNGYEDSHVLPYSMGNDWDAILKALHDIDYDGDFTFESHLFNINYPDDLFLTSLRYMCELGRYMIGKIK